MTFALFHHRVSLLQSMTAVTTCNYAFVVHAAQPLCIQYEYLEVHELSLAAFLLLWCSTYAHQTAHAFRIAASNCGCKSGSKKTLEVVLSNSMSMKAEVATSVAGAMVFTGM